MIMFVILFGFLAKLGLGWSSFARLDSCCLQGVSLKEQLITSVGFSKDDCKGRSDYVNDISKNFNICMHSSCDKEHNPLGEKFVG